jgi:hypothetical protein
MHKVHHAAWLAEGWVTLLSYKAYQASAVAATVVLSLCLQERAALDVSVERAAVALMLGRPQDATRLLGLEGGVDGTAAAGTDDSIKAFVRVRRLILMKVTI